jgi:hypothetical protein
MAFQGKAFDTPAEFFGEREYQARDFFAARLQTHEVQLGGILVGSARKLHLNQGHVRSVSRRDLAM